MSRIFTSGRFFQVAFHGFMSYNKSEQKTSRGVSLSPYTKIHTGLAKLNGLLIKKNEKDQFLSEGCLKPSLSSFQVCHSL